MKLNTINVIEYTDSLITSLRAFNDDKEGNESAESLFKQIVIENGGERPDAESHLDNGYFMNGDYSVFLVHSN